MTDWTEAFLVSLVMKILIPTSSAKTIPDDLVELLTMNSGLHIQLVDTEFPLPYDATFSIEGGKFVLEGGVGPCGYGEARSSFPLRDFNRTSWCPFNIVVESLTSDETAALTELGWEVR